jgi:hypothetical protein
VFGQGILQVMLAYRATPGLGIVTMATAALALWPQPQPTSPPLPEPPPEVIAATPVVETELPCVGAHALVVTGRVTGGASHVQLAGPVLYTDVTTAADGSFVLRIALDDACSVLTAPHDYQFSDGAMTVEYRVGFE